MYFCIKEKQSTMNYTELASEDMYSGHVFEGEQKGQQVHNHEMNLAWQFVASTNVSVFLTGKAGTGKTTFLRKLHELSPKRMVILAPTGVAAINAAGQTIHSFFQLPFGPIVPGKESAERKSYYKVSKDKKNIIKTLDLLVIDEISMVRCDLLDAIDTELRKYKDRTKPFGGVQLLLIGDLQQLAPVAKDSEWQLLSPYYSTPYFFGSKALQQIPYVTIELKHIYRQQDEEFINILGQIRNNQLDDISAKALNERYIPNFVVTEGEEWIRLTTHNNTARTYNEQQLDKLPSYPFTFTAEIHKNFPESSYPADVELVLKKGAQVMFIKNDPTAEHAYYNGKIGVIEGFDEEGNISVFCKEDNTHIAVSRVTWENTKYTVNPVSGDIVEEVDGTFTQYPLRLAWAITIHKSQGLTFDHAVLDINDSFAHGQAYVALSRCRTLEGLVLSRPLNTRSIITDASVNSFINKELEEAKLAEGKLPEMRYQYFLTLLNEMFDFKTLKQDLHYFTRVVDEHLYGSYPDYLAQLKETEKKVDAEITSVGLKFQNQYTALMQKAQNFANDPTLQERIVAASNYFWGKIVELLDPIIAGSKLQLNNKAVSTQYNNALEAFTLSYKIKKGVFSRMISERFTVRNYLSAKAKSILDDIITKDNGQKKKEKKKIDPETGLEIPKKVKVDTKAESFRLYKEGKSIKEIAKERSLTAGTIEGHLAHFVSTGDININDVVSTQHQVFIRGIVKSMSGSYTTSDIKNQLPSDYSYAEIKMVLADMNKDKE